MFFWLQLFTGVKIMKLANTFFLFCFSCAAVFFAIPASAGDYGNYSGKGGMTAYAIKHEAYEYHYDFGFTGVDAMGWDPNLQFAWSRLGAAKTCGLAYHAGDMMKQLIAAFGHDEFTHNLVGADFHHAQSKSNAKFCSPERIKEINVLLPEFANGAFLKRVSTSK